jgi:diguanylate cyclase (GGDEF)-like protein
MVTIELDAIARAILEALPSHTAIVDRAGVVVAVNDGWRRFAEEHPSNTWRPPVGTHLPAALAESTAEPRDHAAMVAAAVSSVIERRQRAFHLDLPDRSAGVERWFALRVTPLDIAAGGALVSFTDITSRKRAETQLAHQALHDPLTGLANRTLFIDRLGLAVARLPRRPTSLAVLFLDLDGFKQINDTYGHSAGDRAIVAIAERIRSALRPGDTAARLGGDEFTILCEDIAAPDDAIAIAERMLAAVAEPVHLAESSVTLSTSVGIAISGARDAPEALLRAADGAMYLAKQHGKARWMLAPTG